MSRLVAYMLLKCVRIGNEGEAALVCRHVSRLVAAGVKPSDIAIITPYNLQVKLIIILFELISSFPSPPPFSDFGSKFPNFDK